jgi:hypothetical protein
LTIILAVYGINILLATHPDHVSLGPPQLLRPLLATGLVYLIAYVRERQSQHFEPFFILSVGAAASLILMDPTLRNLSAFPQTNTAMLVTLIPYLAAITHTVLRRSAPSPLIPITA